MSQRRRKGNAPQEPTDPQEPTNRAPVFVAALVLFTVWAATCAISYTEQERLADRFGFALPWLWPLVFDGVAFALAVMAWADAMDGRTGVLLRLFTGAAISGSSWVNAASVLERTRDHDGTQIGMAAIVPVAAWITFEFLLGLLRRQILRARGVPPPPAIPPLRPVRVLLSPFASLREWRALTLRVTDPARQVNPADLVRQPGHVPAAPVRHVDPLADLVPQYVPPAQPDTPWRNGHRPNIDLSALVTGGPS